MNWWEGEDTFWPDSLMDRNSPPTIRFAEWAESDWPDRPHP